MFIGFNLTFAEDAKEFPPWIITEVYGRELEEGELLSDSD